MKKFTKTGLEHTWGEKEIVKARARRGPGTSSPTPEEMKVYEKFFLLAKNKTKTLVLGATPELRDLAIENGSETTAVDVSPSLLLAQTNNMHYKNDPKNHYLIGDWLEIHKRFPKNGFDIVLADVSLANLPLKSNEKMLKII